jgi:hypothetical protein
VRKSTSFCEVFSFSYEIGKDAIHTRSKNLKIRL